jgi:hypothetical protein
VDEQQWLACTDPKQLLGWLEGEGLTSARKLCLFRVACCRRVWHLLVDDRSRRAVEVAERHADGRATDKELQAADVAGWAARDEAWAARRHTPPPATIAELDARWVAATMAGFVADPNVSITDGVLGRYQWLPGDEAAAQVAIARDLFCPFHPPHIEPAWQVWQDGLIRRLALALYEERDPENGHLDSTRLAVLADALEEAGCCDAALLEHCRGPGTHYRGCFVIDALLGKT